MPNGVPAHVALLGHGRYVGNRFTPNQNRTDKRRASSRKHDTHVTREDEGILALAVLVDLLVEGGAGLLEECRALHSEHRTRLQKEQKDEQPLDK